MTRFLPLRHLFEEEFTRLTEWIAEKPDADQSPDYQAALSRWKRLGSAIAQAEEFCDDQA